MPWTATEDKSRGVYSHLELLVFLCQLATELFELLLHGIRLCKFGALRVFFFLELVATLLGFDVFPFGSLHFG